MEKELQELRKKCKALEAKSEASEKGDEESPSGKEENEHSQKIKELLQELNSLEGIPEGARKHVHGADGTYDEMVEKIKARLKEARAAQRGSKPLDVQMEQTQQSLDRINKRKESLATKVQELEEQQALLAKELAQQRLEMANAEAQVSEVQAQLANLVQQVAQRAKEKPEVTLSSLKSFFGINSILFF